MISTEGLVTHVKFGNEEKANIGVIARKGTLTLQQLSAEKQIGEVIVDGDCAELPKIELEFFNTKSIDAMIKALETIKSNYRPQPEPQKRKYSVNIFDYESIYQLAYAC